MMDPNRLSRTADPNPIALEDRPKTDLPQEASKPTFEAESPNSRGGRIDFDGDFDCVDEASQASFPASDAPSFNPTVGVGPPCHDDHESASRTQD